MLAAVEVAVAVPESVIVVGVIETIVAFAGMPAPVRLMPGVNPAVLDTVSVAEPELEVTASSTVSALSTVQVWLAPATNGAEIVTVPAAPDCRLIPPDEVLGLRVSELEDTVPGAMVMVLEVSAATALGRNSSALMVKLCPKVVFRAAPPERLSAWKMTFWPLPGRFSLV